MAPAAKTTLRICQRDLLPKEAGAFVRFWGLFVFKIMGPATVVSKSPRALLWNVPFSKLNPKYLL